MPSSSAGPALRSLLLGGALASAAVSATALCEDNVIERQLGAMGTWLSVQVEAPDRATALAASERAVAAVEAAEERLSTWRNSSELSQLNAAQRGRSIALSSLLARDLGLALGVAKETGGAFDPTIGALAQSWGLRTGGRLPSRDEIERARAATGYRLITLDGANAIRMHPDVVIEEGGFGKGVALDDAIDALRAAGATRGVLDLGGQIATFGGQQHEVGLADPRDRNRSVLRLRFTDASVSTSGNSEHAVRSGSERIGHLLDPRTGYPAPDFGSMAVIAKSAARADALSTALFVMGPDAALRWARTHRDVDVVVLIVKPNGLRVLASRRLEGRLSAVAAKVELAFDPPGSPALPSDEYHVKKPFRQP